MGDDQYATVEAVDRSLREVRFEPRPSLEAELLWRLRRGGDPPADEPAAISIAGLLALAGPVLGTLAVLLWVKLLTLTPAAS